VIDSGNIEVDANLYSHILNIKLDKFPSFKDIIKIFKRLETKRNNQK